MQPEDLRQRLDAWTGREGAPQMARDVVNPAMIRHWCDAMDDANPVYTDPALAEKSVHGRLVAPPTMLQAWTMRGLRPPSDSATEGGESPTAEVLRLLDAAGYTSVVATNCRQEYERYLHEGEHLAVTTRVASVSEEKQTALGRGRFVDQQMVYRDDAGEVVARMTFRLLKFKPPEESRGQGTPAGSAARARRPHPARTPDSAFFWEAVARHELRIQRCSGCATLRHPPGPMCPECQSLEWDTLLCSGRGRVYSYVVSHHPPLPAFEQPNPIVLVELDEGPRLVSNLVGVEPGEIRIGMPVQVEFTQVDEELVLPLFRPATASD